MYNLYIVSSVWTSVKEPHILNTSDTNSLLRNLLERFEQQLFGKIRAQAEDAEEAAAE